MNLNITFPLGGIVMIENAEKSFGIFSKIFGGAEDKIKDFVPRVKLLVYNRLTHSVSISQIPNTYPEEVARRLGMDCMPPERTINRTLERIGRHFSIFLDRYQQLINEHGWVDRNEVLDFSSTYIEGEKAEFGAYGYSRDKRPDKLQINFGLSTGITGIPTALTIQKGNTQDKKHLKELLKVISKVIPKNSLLIFDAGANTMRNKKRIRKLMYHYLTLKPKKVKIYRAYIRYFKEKLVSGQAKHFKINERNYTCVVKRESENTFYIFFCLELYETQILEKEKKFERQKARGNKILRRRKTEKIPSDDGWVELIPHLQKTLFAIDNPYINGLEGFFILESSVDDEPEKILKLYKERDKAEKFIRALKEGLELRPIRHWSKYSIIGTFFICFLTNFLINLTRFLKKKNDDKNEKVPHKISEKFDTKTDEKDCSVIKNVKLLKKFLINLSMTVVYPKKGFRFFILSNVSPQILNIFGDFVWKYEDKSLELRW